MLVDYFADNNSFIGVAKTVLDWFTGINDEADELNEKEIAPEMDVSGVNTSINLIEEYMQKVDQAVAKAGTASLALGKNVTATQAAELQKVFYNTVLGAYGNTPEKIEEYFQKEFQMSWSDFMGFFLPNGSFNADKITLASVSLLLC